MRPAQRSVASRVRWARAVGSIALAVALAGCADNQDPGLVDAPDGPTTTSDTLGRCPAGGPDATTPVAGCLGPDGQVVRP